MTRALPSFPALIILLLVLVGCGEEPTPTATPFPTRPPRPTTLPTPVAVPTPDCVGVYFRETNYIVCEPFLAYWRTKGDVTLFGYPISDQIQETDETGQTYTAQYFERARLELHPSTGNQVLLGRLGALLQTPERPAEPLRNAQYFPETGHNLADPFRRFWAEKGGLAVFGFPITESRVEVSPTDGKEYTVQWFERARMEYHPENARTPFEVQLGQLGTQLYKKKYSR